MLRHDRSDQPVGRRALRHRVQRGRHRRRDRGVARLRRPDRRRRSARGRDRARPRLRRRRRRAHLRPPRRPDRPRDRARHDRRDARARPRATPPRRARPTSSSSRATSRTSRSPDDSVDVVISNCVINLSADKHRVIREAARVLRPGGRFAVSDVIADPDMDAATRADMQQWTGCIAGALTARRVRERAARRRARRRRDHRDPPRARARGLGDHPRPQGGRGVTIGG